MSTGEISILQRYNTDNYSPMLPFELGSLAAWTDHTWSKWVTAFICFSFRATDGKVLLSDPLIAPQSAVGKQSPMRRRERTRPHLHNQSERLPRFGLIKYSSGEIVDYAAAATIAASPARARSLPQWKDSTKRVDKTAVTIDGYVTRKRTHEHPETLRESEFCGVTFRL